MSFQSVKRNTENRPAAHVEVSLSRFQCGKLTVQTVLFWQIKTHSCIHIWQNNQQETEQTAPVFRNSHPHCYQTWVTLPVFLLFKWAQCIVGKDERYNRHLLWPFPLPTSAGSRKSALPFPPHTFSSLYKTLHHPLAPFHNSAHYVWCFPIKQQHRKQNRILYLWRRLCRHFVCTLMFCSMKQHKVLISMK